MSLTHGEIIRSALFAFTAIAVGCLDSPWASAQRISNDVAVFAALDKVTAAIKKLEVPLGQTQQFGSLEITPRVCYSRPATEKPKTTTFVEVEEISLNGEKTRVFTGWMFAESPGINAVEHPVFDIWLTSCSGPQASEAAVVAPEGETGASEATTADNPPPPRRRRRIRR